MSWTQTDPSMSLKLIGEACSSGRVIDVGGGRSKLCERLLDLGYSATVLDISSSAIEAVRMRLGTKASQIDWLIADVLASPALETFDVWHDRAVFHFLTSLNDRRTYMELLKQTVSASGHVVMATFALDGPAKCSGLEVQRYNAQTLSEELGAEFVLLKSESELHVTPWGARQPFQFSLLKRI